jgi:hypothetical protein
MIIYLYFCNLLKVTGEFLRILQATMDDRGVYVCSASNVAGTAQASAIVEIERKFYKFVKEKVF